MHKVVPQVFVVGETRVNREGLDEYLKFIGAPDWTATTGLEIEEIVEVFSRSCYRSFDVGLNPNVTMVRKNSEAHLANIIESEHGSVLEHGWVSFMLCNISRVLTHELVRHRPGVAISQESLRYVRLEDMGLWVPSYFQGNAEAEAIFAEAWGHAEKAYKALLIVAAKIETGNKYATLEDFDKLPFVQKKKATSPARRVAPIGVATNIGWSCNMRMLRHVIEMRTDPGAEEEIKMVFGMVGSIARQRWPHLFGDYRVSKIDGAYKSPHMKV